MTWLKNLLNTRLVGSFLQTLVQGFWALVVLAIIGLIVWWFMEHPLTPIQAIVGYLVFCFLMMWLVNFRWYRRK